MADRGSYVGLDVDLATGEGVTPIAKIVLDAQLFSLIAEGETCMGWPGGKIQNLYDDVMKAWNPYGSLPSLLPADLREKHEKLYGSAIKQAKKNGWDPDQDLENDR